MPLYALNVVTTHTQMYFRGFIKMIVLQYKKEIEYFFWNNTCNENNIGTHSLFNALS